MLSVQKQAAHAVLRVESLELLSPPQQVAVTLLYEIAWTTTNT